jgi:branched-chain amino acid transport system ATP-binding protein
MIVEQNVVSALNISGRGYVVQNGKTVLEGVAKDLLANEELRAAYFGTVA